MLGGSFSNKDNVRATNQFRRERQFQYLKRLFFFKNRPIQFQIVQETVPGLIHQYQYNTTDLKNVTDLNSTRFNTPLKRKNLCCFDIEKKPLPFPVYCVSLVRSKFRSQLWLLLKIRYPITLGVVLSA